MAILTANVKREDLCNQILNRRDGGKVTCAIHSLLPTGAPREIADTVLQQHGFRPLAAQWREVDRPTALRLVAHVLHQDLAYAAELMPATEALDLATAFIAAADASSCFLTNAAWSNADASTTGIAAAGPWSPASDATIDVGVVAVGATCALILWVEDED